jgi:hypothetical protein
MIETGAHAQPIRAIEFAVIRFGIAGARFFFHHRGKHFVRDNFYELFNEFWVGFHYAPAAVLGGEDAAESIGYFKYIFSTDFILSTRFV